MFARTRVFFASLVVSSLAVAAESQSSNLKAQIPASAGASTPSAFVAEHQRAGQVSWLGWGDAAFARAREQNKPLYVHVGALTSELSRDMARQSFANADTARYLNENFVCVLVDRDEHPDVAAVYRAWLQQAKQLNGWPLNLWLTPDLKPLEGSTYLPPSEEWGKPGLVNVAKQVAGAWQADAAAQRSRAEEAIATLTSAAGAEVKPLPAAALQAVLADNASAWEARFDTANGGFGDPPKRLEPELLRYLLRHDASRAHAVATLVALARGAIRDPLDGGFFRQASDPAFRQPYLQKHAADQARLALAYLDALAVGGSGTVGAGLPRDSAPDQSRDKPAPTASTPVSDAALLQAAARGALRYLTTQLHDAKLGYLAAEDASGEGGAAYYLWTLADVQAALGADAATTAAALGITAEGNLPADAYAVPGVTAPNLPYLAAEKPAVLTDAARQKMLAARAKRPAPRRDATTSAATHGLILFALSRAAAELNDADLRAAAQHQATFIRERLRQPDGSLRHLPHRDSSALAEDYVYVAKGLRAYAAATKDAAAEKLAAECATHAAALLDTKAGRFVVTKTGPLSALGQVHLPAPAPGELPSAESAYLGYLLRADPKSPAIAALTTALAREAQDSPDAARGDLLLALDMAGK